MRQHKFGLTNGLQFLDRDYSVSLRNGGYGNGNGRSSAGLAGPRSVERRRLKSGAPAHAFTTEERRRGAERTNEIAMAIAITDRIRELGLDADAENIAGEGLRQPGE